MKTAGYDIAVLINENFLNQLSGALFYGGFMTLNGSVDFYNGRINLEHQTQAYRTDLASNLSGKVASELQPFLNLDFRFKLTQEPMLDFIQGTTSGGQRLRIAMGLRIYFWLWQGLEIKFDASISASAPLFIDSKMNLVADLVNADIQEMTLKYGTGMEPQMTEKLNGIVQNALHMYFANHTICKPLAIPSISAVIKDVDDYIQPDKDPNGRDLGILPITVDTIKIVSPTVLAVGINLMGYHGGNPDQLVNFARNCSLAVGVSETCMFKTFHYVWTHSAFVKQFGSNANMMLVKDYNSLTVAQSGTFKVKLLDEFFDSVTEIASAVATITTKALTGGFLEASVDYQGMDFKYDMAITLKNEPKFDLLGGNLVRLYNMAIGIMLHLSCNCSIEYEVDLDTSGWIPDSWTPWDDDVTLYKEKQCLTLFDSRIRIDNLELRYGEAELQWNEVKQSLEIQITKINFYWNFNNPGSPLHGLPGKLINWITDILEEEIVKHIRPIAVTPSLSFDLPILPWPLQMTGRSLEITDSEAIMAADFGFKQLEKGKYPVAKYIVNINNGEIHKIGCDSVTDTYEVHQRGYHLLSEALNLGFDGCHNCLPAFHKR